MEYRNYGIATPGRIEGNPSLAIPRETFVSMRFPCGCFEKKHTMAQKLWKKLQDRQDLPPQMLFNTNLPCPCKSCFESPEASAKVIFGPWMENAQSRIHERHILLAELVWIMAFLKENPRLRYWDTDFFSWGREAYELLGGADADSHFPSLLALTEDVYGVVSAPHMALHRGLRHSVWCANHPDTPQFYHHHLNQDLDLLRPARARLHQWLEQRESDGDAFRVSTQELNELFYAHADLYTWVALQLVSVAGSYTVRFPTSKASPLVPFARYGNQLRVYEPHESSLDEAAGYIHSDAEILRLMLSDAELTGRAEGEIPMPIREDPRIKTIAKMEKQTESVVEAVNGHLAGSAPAGARPDLLAIQL